MIKWRTSSRSGGNNGGGSNCVQIAEVAEEESAEEESAVVVLIRDSKDPDGPWLRVAPANWSAFTDGVRSGRLNL